MSNGVNNEDYLLLEVYHLHTLINARLNPLREADQLNRHNESAWLPDYPTYSAKDNQTALPCDDLEKISTRRQAFLQQCDSSIPLIQLQKSLDYNDVDHIRLMLLLAPKLDPRFHQLYKTCSQILPIHPYHPDFASYLLNCSWHDKLSQSNQFTKSNPLRQFRLVVLDKTTQHMKLEERVLSFVLQHNEKCDDYTNYSTTTAVALPEYSINQWLKPIQHALLAQSARSGLWLSLRGDDPSLLLAQAAKHVDTQLLPLSLNSSDIAQYEVELLQQSADALLDEHWGKKIDVWLREALLSNAQPALNLNLENADNNKPAFRSLLNFISNKLKQYPRSFVISSNQDGIPEAFQQLSLQSVSLEPFNAAMRARLWCSLQNHSGSNTEEQSHSSDTTQKLATLAQTYNYDFTTSLKLMQQTRTQMQSQKNRPVNQLLTDECINEAQLHVSTLGQLRRSNYTFDDIILPSNTKQQLLELCETTQLQNQVRHHWGLGKKLIPNTTITALFAGSTGTGKSLSAEIVANKLGRPLLRVDLAAIVSKYIGDTEKNIDRIFQEAEDSCSIVFFDEADACFGQRSEVREAHDRYANIQVSYLLQRMESFQGVAILATNLRQHLDSAFIRRITMTVSFPFPSALQRAELWRHLIPEELPREAQLQRPAFWDYIGQKYKFSGGNIRNAIVSSAYHAAMHDRPLSYDDIIHGITREYQKMGTQLPGKSNDVANDMEISDALPIKRSNGSVELLS